MAFTEISRFYPLSDFDSLPVGSGINVPMFLTHLASGGGFDVPFVLSLAPGGQALRVDWPEFPSLGDLAQLAALVASFPGGTPNANRVLIESLGEETSTATSLTPKIEYETEPLLAGVYLVTWSSSLYLPYDPQIRSAQAVCLIATESGVALEQKDTWASQEMHAFNGSITVSVAEGESIDVTLSFAKESGSGPVAMSDARITIDKLS